MMRYRPMIVPKIRAKKNKEFRLGQPSSSVYIVLCICACEILMYKYVYTHIHISVVLLCLRRGTLCCD
jgi:hypothetical protein